MGFSRFAVGREPDAVLLGRITAGLWSYRRPNRKEGFYMDKIRIRWYTSVPFIKIGVEHQWTLLLCLHCFPQLSVPVNLSYPAGSSGMWRSQFLRSLYPQMGVATAPKLFNFHASFQHFSHNKTNGSMVHQ